MIMLLAALVCAQAYGQDDSPAPRGLLGLSFRAGVFNPTGSRAAISSYSLGSGIGYMVGLEMDVRINSMFSVGFGFDYYNLLLLPLGECTYMEADVLPMTFTVRFSPFREGFEAGGSRIIPWIGGGFGIYTFGASYYEESYAGYDYAFGEYYDYHYSESVASGLAAAPHLAAGLVIPVAGRWEVLGEFRYAFIEDGFALPCATVGVCIRP